MRKMRPGGKVEGQRDMRKKIIALRSLTKAPKNKLLVKRLQWGAVSHTLHIQHVFRTFRSDH